MPALEQFLGSTAGLSPAMVTRLKAQRQADHVLVLMGMRADSTMELITMANGYRESSEAWAGLLRDCAGRGMRMVFTSSSPSNYAGGP